MNALQSPTFGSIGQFWDDTSTKMLELAQRHHNDEFACDVLVAIHSQLERATKELRKDVTT